MMRRWLLPLSFATVWLSTGTASAGNDDEQLVGNQAAMLAGAVSATVSDSSASWYNPAGLGAIERDQFDASATVYTLRTYDAPQFIMVAGGASDDGSVLEFVVSPSQIAYVRKLRDGMSLGLGYFVPNASNYVLREGVRDRSGSISSDWQLAATGSHIQHNGVAALGVAVTPRIRFGVQVIGGYSTNTESITLFGAVSQGDERIASATTTVVGTTSSISMQLGLGLQLDLTPELTAGVTYRSPELQLNSTFDGSTNQTLAVVLAPDMAGLSAEAAEIDEPPSIELLRAGRAGLSLAYRYGRGRVVGEVDVQPGLHRPEVGVDRRALVNARLALYHAFSEVVAFGVGLFTDRSPNAERIDFVDGRADFYGATLGLELSNEHALAEGERAGSLIFSSVFALRYAHCAGDFGRVVADPVSIVDAPFNVVAGRIYIHELTLYVGGGLAF